MLGGSRWSQMLKLGNTKEGQDKMRPPPIVQNCQAGTCYCTLNLTHFLNCAVFLTTSCEQTFRVGLDLTCSSSRGLNFEDFPFFYFLNWTSGSRVSPILRLPPLIMLKCHQFTTNHKIGLTRLPEVRSRK